MDDGLIARYAAAAPARVGRGRFARRLVLRVAGLALMLAAASATALAAEPYRHGLLWRLDKPGVPSSWVYGTLHSSDPRVTVLPHPVERAFASARAFAMEIYLSEVEEAGFFDAMQFDDQRRLPPLLGDEAYGRLREVLGERVPQDEVLARTKPWAALLRVGAARATTRARDGPTLDRRLFAAARQRGMTVVGLESLDEQVAAFDAIPLATQVALLRHALDHLPELDAQLEPAIQAWLSRDLARLAKLSAEAAGGDAELARHYAELTHQLIENRSVLMAHRLFLPLQHGRVFVAVGALHLYGSKGLLALLREQGYRPHRVY